MNRQSWALEPGPANENGMLLGPCVLLMTRNSPQGEKQNPTPFNPFGAHLPLGDFSPVLVTSRLFSGFHAPRSTSAPPGQNFSLASALARGSSGGETLQRSVV